MSERARFVPKRSVEDRPLNGGTSPGDSDSGQVKEQAEGAQTVVDQRVPPVGDYEPGFGLPDQKVLGELSHELGNYFHKIYYWLDYLSTHTVDGAESEVPLQMLEGTVKGLEGFSRMALEYFAPARLHFTKLKLGEVFAGTAAWSGGRHLRVEGIDRWRETVVFVDPARLNHVLRTVLQCINRTFVHEDEVRICVAKGRRDEFDGIEIRFVAGECAENLVPLTAGIEMSVAEKFLKVHGGELFECEENGVHIVGMFLPLYR